jgi:PAS domain S-box-containing protein
MVVRSRDERQRESELKLRLALRASEIGIWDWNIASGEMQYSARARTICGFRPDEQLTIDNIRRITHPDDLQWTSPKALRALDPAVRDRSPYEYRIIRADNGEVRWVVAHGEAVFRNVNGSMTAVRYIGSLQDITGRKEAEQALEASERRLKLAIDAARIAVWEYDVGTDTVAPSPQLNRLFGLPEDARPTMEQYRALYSDEERQKIRQAGEEALARGSSHFEAEFQCTWPDNSNHWLQLRADVLFDRDGQPTRVIGVLLDIDERKRTEHRLALLLREVNHRVKNSLSVVQALANQSFRDEAPHALPAFRARLLSLAAANQILLDRDFGDFALKDLVEEITAPYSASGRTQVGGPDVLLPPRLGTPIALVLHELATNAAKYGALSNGEGRLTILWHIEDKKVRLIWQESGGPEVAPNPRKGFGTRLIDDVLRPELGEVQLTFRPGGVRYELLLSP